MIHPPQPGYPASMFEPECPGDPGLRVITPPHPHKGTQGFGPFTGCDVQYKDVSGMIHAQLDGLRPDEAEFLRLKPPVHG